MPLTSQVGTSDARFGNIELGNGVPATTFSGFISDTITFTEVMAGHNLSQTATDTLTFSDVMSGFAVRGESVDSLTFSEVLFRNIESGQTISDTLTFTEQVIHTIFATFSDDLTFTDEMDGFRYTAGFPTDTLTLTEALTRQFLAERTINEGLPFTELLTKNANRLRALSESLSLTDVMVGLNVKAARDTLTLTETLTSFIAKLTKDFIDWDSIFSVNVNYGRPTADVFEMYDTILLNTYLRRALSDTLTFTEIMLGVRVTPITESITFTEALLATSSKIMKDSFSFIDILKVTKVQQVSAEDNLNFVDSTTANFVITKVVPDILTLADTMRSVLWKFATISDTLTFSDLLVRQVFKATIPDTLDFTDVVTTHKIGGRKIVETLALADSVFVNISYSRALADTLVFTEAPPPDTLPPSAISIPPGLGGAIGVVAGREINFFGQRSSVTIKPAEFNDFVTDRNQTIFKRRMDGSVSTFIKTCAEQKLHYEFLVPQPKAAEFRAFLDSENGNAFTIYDWNGYVWIAKLLTDAIDKTEVGRWDPCGNKTHIVVEFIGRRYA